MSLSDSGDECVRWVKQEHANGCVVAALAMVTGKTYREVHEFLSACLGRDFETVGACWHGDGDMYLIENGYALQTKYRYLWANQQRARWPVEPSADVHICSVRTSQSHAVVMLRDGTVLDPLTPDLKRLSDYSAVDSITAIYKPGGSR